MADDKKMEIPNIKNAKNKKNVEKRVFRGRITNEKKKRFYHLWSKL